MPLLAALLVPAPVGAAAPSAPTNLTLTAGAQQLTASWTAPAGTVDDYDVEYRACTNSSDLTCASSPTWGNWQGNPDHDHTNTFGLGSDPETVSADDPLDLGDFSFDAVTRTGTVEGRTGVYEIKNAMDQMQIAFRRSEWTTSTLPTLDLRYAATKPTNANLDTHGDSWKTVPIATSGSHSRYDLPLHTISTASQLSVGTYFWFVSSSSHSMRGRTLQLVIDLATTETSKTIAALTDGTAYQVRVRAGNSSGDGNWSTVATETAGAKPSTPAAPTVASKDASLAVSWTAPDANDPGGITDYDVQYRACTANCPADLPTQDSRNVSGAMWGNWAPLSGSDDPGTSTSATIRNLTNGTLYQVQVLAKNARGDSGWSPSTTTRPGLPDAPAMPKVTSEFWHTVDVDWTVPTANGPAVTAYIARAKPTGSTVVGWTHSPTVIAPATSGMIGQIPSPLNSLIADTAYSVQVRAKSSAGWGPWSPVTSFRTRAKTPDAPTAPTLVSDDNGLTASWTAPASNDFDILDYDVRWSSDGGSTWTVLLDQKCATACSGSQAASDDTSDGPARNPLDLMNAGNSPYTFSGSNISLTEETATSGSDGVYKLNTAVAGLYVKVTAAQKINSVDNTLVPLRARTAATKPGSGANLSTVGSEIWSASPASTGQDFSGSGWTLPLPANSYFWVAADSHKDYDDPTPSFNVRVASTATTRSVSSLTNGTTYHVQVRAGNEKGYGDWSPSATVVAGMPDAVAAPKLEAGVGQVRVSWDTAADRGSAITDYDVQYRACTVTDKSCATSPKWGDWSDVSHTGTGRNATISSLTDGTSYQVRVRAANARGTGPWSPSASIIVGVPTPPAAPTLASGNGTLTATWTAPADNGSAITDYDVRYCSTSCTTDANWTDVSHTGTAKSATISTLANGTAYEVQVRAANARGTGAWSPSATDKPGRPQRSSKPTLTPAARQIAASWTATTANGLSVTDYDVRYSSDSGTTWTEWNASNTSTTASATITGLTPNTSYQVQVRAESSAGSGAWSASTSTTTLTAAPEAPAAPQLSAGATSLTVAWTAPANNGSTITDYDVRYCTGTCRTAVDADWTEWNASDTSTAPTTTITGLTADTSYQVQVRATNGRGDSPWSASATALTGAPAQIDAPTLAASAGQLAVSWTAPNSNGATIDDYDVRYRRVGTSDWNLYDGGVHDRTKPPHNVTSPTSDTVSTSDPLDNDTVPLAAITRESVSQEDGFYKINNDIDELRFHFVGNSTGGETLELRHASAKPTSTTNLHTQGRRLGNSATTGTGQQQYRIVTTIESTATNPLSADSAFWLAATGSLSFGERYFGLWVDLKSTGTSHTITGLTNGVAYEVQVRAGNSRGDGSWSASTQATMPTQPAAPDAPALTPGDKQLGVTWSSPADNGESITDFDVQYSSDSGATWTEWKASTTSTAIADTITGLTNGTEYRVQVRATNAVGDSPWSASATATPHSPAVRLPGPGIPGGIAATRTTGSATVSWTSPGGSYLKYQMLYREVTGDTWVPNPSYPMSGWVSVIGTQSDTSATMTSWDDAKTYVAAVRARDHATGLYGDWGVSDLLAPVGTPPRVGDIEVTRVTVGGSHAMRVTWDKLSDSTVSSYEAAWSEDTSPRSWQTALPTQATNCTPTCTQPFIVDPSKNYVVRVRSATSAGKYSHWVESAASYSLGIDSLSATREPGDADKDDDYVGQKRLDVVATWASNSNAASYRVRMFYRTGNPASFYDTTDTNTNANSKPDDWNMDWQWYSWCNDAESLNTYPPNGNDTSPHRGCNDPFANPVSTDYLEPIWSFNLPAWSDEVTVETSACTGTPSKCSYTFEDATVGGTTVKVEVWAVDSSNTAGPVATYTTHPASPPGAPLSVTPVAPSGASVQVQWVQAYNGGSPVIGFDVKLLQCTVTPNACVEHLTVTDTKGTALPDANRDPRDHPVLTYTFHGVPTNFHYKAMVRAQNIEGYSGWEVARDDVGLTPTKPPPPAAPTVAISGTTATVTWMAPADDGGSTVTGYLVQYRKKGAGGIWSDTWTDHAYSGTVCSGTASCSTTVTVDAGSTVPDYQFRVAATNSIAAGDDRYSSVGAPGAPTGVTATAAAGGVSVTWTQPADIGTSPVVAADIRTRVSSPQGTWSGPKTPATNPGASPAVITGLTAGTAYDVQIRVRNANGAGPWADAGTVTPS